MSGWRRVAAGCAVALAALCVSVSVLAQAAAEPTAQESKAMGDYASNVGLYVFVVGVALMFGLGVIAGMKR